MKIPDFLYINFVLNSLIILVAIYTVCFHISENVVFSNSAVVIVCQTFCGFYTLLHITNLLSTNYVPKKHKMVAKTIYIGNLSCFLLMVFVAFFSP
jgi:hypothetical protein